MCRTSSWLRHFRRIFFFFLENFHQSNFTLNLKTAKTSTSTSKSLLQQNVGEAVVGSLRKGSSTRVKEDCDGWLCVPQRSSVTLRCLRCRGGVCELPCHAVIVTAHALDPTAQYWRNTLFRELWTHDS